MMVQMDDFHENELLSDVMENLSTENAPHDSIKHIIAPSASHPNKGHHK